MASMNICVVGAGVTGVSTAQCIREQYRDAKMTLLSDREFSKITSFGPPGMFREGDDEHL
jgi:NADH dehydrogenase FAD-containing subunit